MFFASIGMPDGMVKCSPSAPTRMAISLAVSAAIEHGTSAAYCMMPTLTTSIEKTVAVSGVPNNAEKAALIPHIIIIF